MSLISVDFVSLFNEIDRMEKYREAVTEAVSRVGSVNNALAEMALGDIEDELSILLRRLQDSADDIDRQISKLRKILELYNECEMQIEKAVDNLPLNMPLQSDRPVLGTVSGSGNRVSFDPFAIKLGSNSFTGHSVINDEWLNDLIY